MISSASGRCAAVLVAAAALTGFAGTTGTPGTPGTLPRHSAARPGAVRPGAVRPGAVRPGAVRTDRDLVSPLPPAARADAGGGSGQTADGQVRTAGSLNWAGYAVSRRAVTFRSVSATFFVPYLNCAQSPGIALSSAWAGLDGFTAGSDSVEQTGIAASCSAGGTPSYFGWIEMFPYAEAKIPMRIRPGDSVTATVSFSAARRQFELTLSDSTTGRHYTRYRGCPDVRISGSRLRCSRSSAEVIAEAPETGSGKQLAIAPLADYGAISFARIAITDSAGQRGSLIGRHWATTRITQVRGRNGPALALPTAVADNDFSTYWVRES